VSSDDEDARIGQLIERLVLDPLFRTQFRADPAGLCRAFGLDELAQDLAPGGKAMHTLELRESRSSLAGVVMALAAEGVAVGEFHQVVGQVLHGHARASALKALKAGHVKSPAAELHRFEGKLRPHGEAARLERQLKTDPPGHAAASGSAPPSASGGNAAPPASTGANASSAAPGGSGGGAGGASGAGGGGSGAGGSAATAAPGAGAASHPVAAAASASGSAGGVARGNAGGAVAQAGSSGPSVVGGSGPSVVGGSGPSVVGGSGPSVVGGAGPSVVESASSVGGGAGGGGVVGQVGDVVARAGVGGGSGSGAVAELLSSPRLSLPPAARVLFEQGGVDPRVTSLLESAVAHHTIVVGDVESVVEPVHAQAVDIVSVDGEPVGPGNVAARDLITEIAALDPSVRPSEIGTPWPIEAQGFFTDSAHQGRLHLGFVSQSDYSPGGVGVGSAGDVSAGGGGVVGPVAATPAAQGVAQAADAQIATDNAPPPVAQPVVLDQAVGQNPSPGLNQAVGQDPSALLEQQMGAGAGANPKVQAMINEADSLLGKPYVFGGGHAGWGPSAGYDCSGFVSNVLHAGGYLSAPVDTTALPDQPGILPGPGQFVTIYDRALSGENGHVIIDINGQFYESGGMHGAWGGGGGVEKIGRPDAAYLATFPNVLHPAGL
jgi:cell wall-associated NlpC family hydrolase